VRPSRNRRTRGGRRRRRTADKSAEAANTQESKSAEKVSTVPKAAQDTGPPRARTDEERARDSVKLDDAAPHKVPVPEKGADSTQKPKSRPKPKPVAEPKPTAEDGGQAQATTRLLPWEPRPAADIKPPPITAAPKPAPKPEGVHATEPLPAAAPKPDSKPPEQPPQD
jgi:hypothetical protein